jgi:2'-5' RNA ligase
VILSKADNSNGVMVALYPSADVAQTLAQPGGEPAGQIHLTVLYLGRADKLDQPERLAPVVASVAAQMPPLQGEIAGVGHFTEGDGVDIVTWAAVDLPGLDKLRVAVCEAAGAAGFESPSGHGFTPHITLDDRRIEPDIPNLELVFDAVSLVIAGERHNFPLTGKCAADRSMMGLLDWFRSEAEIDKADYSTEERIALAREGKAIPIREDGEIVGGRYPINTSADLDNAISAFGRAKDKGEVKAFIIRRARTLGETDKLPDDWTSKAEFVSPLWKDDAQQIVYGVVMQPQVTDSQGDTVSAEEIEKAAHRYLAESRLHDVQHAEEEVEAVPVESFIAPCDMEYHGRPVLKGSWVMATHVVDPAVWQQVVKGELTGYSIGGTAERVG